MTLECKCHVCLKCEATYCIVIEMLIRTLLLAFSGAAKHYKLHCFLHLCYCAIF